MGLFHGPRATLVVALVAACGYDPGSATEPLFPPAAPRASAALAPLDPFGIGEKLPGSRGCTADEYRQFDFWLGNWDVFGGAAGTTLVGTNVVRSQLGGCAVEENWTPNAPFGQRGRSLNAYDASTGTWSQMWVSSSGCPFGTIVVEGGLADGSMTMSGRREEPEGFLVAPPCGPPPPVIVFAHTDLIRWTPLESGSVLQQFASANNDAPLIPPPPPSTGIGLRYDPVAAVTPLNPTPPSFCPTRAAARQFDFMLGAWDVHEGNGNGAQGTAVWSTDLRGCLVEERLAGPGGYEGWSFNTFDVFTQAWLRTYVDSDGQRIYMTGGLADGRMVLTGVKNGSAGRAVTVRVTWDPVADGRVVQRWEYSLDGGASWKAGKEIVYTKR